ncbi:MAG: PAAR domain-containing protein, partial [Myxococcota bacterium]
IVMIPSPGGPVATPLPAPFKGPLMESLCGSVEVENMPSATKDSVALCNPPHIPAGGPFQKPPSHRGTITQGSQTVLFENKAAARSGDTAMTCNDPADAPNGVVMAQATVFVGD